MNYRHSFHAGNFADLHKHAVLLILLGALKADGRGLTVVDTHAGAGVYDLTNDDQARSREAEAGVRRLMAGDLPEPFAPLVKAVEALNGAEPGSQLYPGSPWLIVSALGDEDRYVGCELRPQVQAELAAVLARTSVPAEAVLADGYETARAVSAEGGLLVLIDPPYEQRDDYRRAAETVGAVLQAAPDATLAVWTPLKDLETLDGFLRDLKAKTGVEAWVSEARMRPLSDPMRMNGSVMVLVQPPAGIEAAVTAVGEALVSVLGDAGSEARLWRA